MQFHIMGQGQPTHCEVKHIQYSVLFIMLMAYY